MTVASTVVRGDTLRRVQLHAENATINGKSWVRGDDRVERGPVDQLVGQLGEYALAKFLGDADSYFRRREEIDLTPTVGDDGSDFLGAPVDVKCSLMRASSNPLKYRLLVRPRERHESTIYVLALCTEVTDGFKVYLVGWAPEEDLPAQTATEGPFSGAFVLSAAALKPMRTLAQALKNRRQPVVV